MLRRQSYKGMHATGEWVLHMVLCRVVLCIWMLLLLLPPFLLPVPQGYCAHMCQLPYKTGTAICMTCPNASILHSVLYRNMNLARTE